jgi:WD40 repeat protein
MARFQEFMIALFTLRSFTNMVESVAYAPDGKTVLTGSDDGTVWLWDARTGNLVREVCPRVFGPGWQFAANGIGLVIIVLIPLTALRKKFTL